MNAKTHSLMESMWVQFRSVLRERLSRGPLLAVTVGFVVAGFLAIAFMMAAAGAASSDRPFLFLPYTVNTLVFVTIVYAPLGGVFGFGAPRRSWTWGIWVSSPVVCLTIIAEVVILVAFLLGLIFDTGLRDGKAPLPGFIIAAVAILPVALGSLGSACVGAYGGAWLRKTIGGQ